MFLCKREVLGSLLCKRESAGSFLCKREAPGSFNKSVDGIPPAKQSRNNILGICRILSCVLAVKIELLHL